MKRGLGKGLDALFADSDAESAQGQPVTLRLTEIEPNKGQPRKEFEPEALAQLADSIKHHGILQPLVVRPIPGTGTYQLVAGERRWRAARMAGLSEAPVIIKELDDAATMEIALIENLQREDLNPIEEAEGYQMLMDNFGLKQEEVAQRVGKSRPAVANVLRLLNLPESVRDMVKKGGLSSGHARALLAVENSDEMESIASEIVKKGLSVREVEKWIRQRDKPKALPHSQQPGVVETEAESLLTGRLGRKVTIQPGKNKGTVQIEYYGEDDLKQLVRLIARES